MSEQSLFPAKSLFLDAYAKASAKDLDTVYCEQLALVQKHLAAALALIESGEGDPRHSPEVLLAEGRVGVEARIAARRVAAALRKELFEVDLKETFDRVCGARVWLKIQLI